jgi:hypothetical protein
MTRSVIGAAGDSISDLCVCGVSAFYLGTSANEEDSTRARKEAGR